MPEESHVVGEGAVEGNREKNRQETRRQIARAAVELFERQGVAGTTVEEIAELAGVSPRTFYRHAATKENAVFVDDDGLDVLRARVGAVEQTTAAVIEAIERTQRAQIEAFDLASEAEHARLLRLRRLVLDEPALLARALFREEEAVQVLTTIVHRAGGGSAEDETRARTVVTAMGTAVRLTFDEWARRAERGEAVLTRALYDEIRRDLTAYFTGGGVVAD